MKIKGSAIASLVVSVAVVFLAAVYFTVALPVLNFIYNPLTEDPSGQNGGVLIESGDILDFSGLRGDSDLPLAPDATMPPAQPVKPGGVISEPTRIRGTSVKFREGTKNILLLGYNQGLADSIFILNIDEENKNMKLVSIPRDTYVPYTETVKNIMVKNGFFKSLGAYKLNATTYVGNNLVRYNGGKFGNSGIDFMCSIIDGLLPYGCKIDEYVYVDFEGFMDIIDAVGGVEVTIPENMYTREGELVLAKGKQRINAEQALFYVRYRYRLDESGNNLGTGGDNYRKMNQINFLVEISSQLITKENMEIGKITSMMESLKKSVFHSFNSIDKITDYASIGMDFANGEYSIESYVVEGDDMSYDELESLSGRGFDHSSYVTIFR